ncbi:hypothetical protein AB0D08_15740 [Kitasatospora sp. NPDC048540]|uniref:hypothetical protein n=1 Tax=unclassified Kitasatospora TaxID=2633591 RepID=UPI000539E0AC|nr:hypothetical protein [Kitasatospora sp. MBT63]
MTPATRTTAVPVPGLTTVKSIIAGASRALALLADGTVMSWGLNDKGQLGGVSQTAAGCNHSLAVTDSDNRLKAWGHNTSGQLGNGTTEDSSKPVTTLTAPTGVDKIAAPVGGDFSLAT